MTTTASDPTNPTVRLAVVALALTGAYVIIRLATTPLEFGVGVLIILIALTIIGAAFAKRLRGDRA